MADDDIIEICTLLIAILLPPLGVYLKKNCTAEFWICVLLTLLGYIPGIIYALYIILQVLSMTEFKLFALKI